MKKMFLFSLKISLLFITSSSFPWASFDGIFESQEQEAPRSRVSLKSFYRQFSLQKRLGSGGQAKVYEVTDKTTGNHFALVVEGSSHKSPVEKKDALYETLMKVQKSHPHMAHIHHHFWIEHQDCSFDEDDDEIYPCFKTRGKRILREAPFQEGAVIHYHEAALMELGLADLSSQQFKNLKISTDVIQFQFFIANQLFASHGVLSCDNFPRNYIFMSSEKAFYKGHKMSDFDVWRYQVGEEKIDIPKQEYVIKRIDYNDFLLTQKTMTSKPGDFMMTLQNRDSLNLPQTEKTILTLDVPL